HSAAIPADGRPELRISRCRAPEHMPRQTAPSSTAGGRILREYRMPVEADEGGPFLLSVEDLTIRFGGVTAVRQASIHVGASETVALIGPNGAGKTTMFDAIAGQNRTSGGRIMFGGEDISRTSALWRSRNGIRRTFQRQQTFPGLTVEDNVLVALESP